MVRRKPLMKERKMGDSKGTRESLKVTLREMSPERIQMKFRIHRNKPVHKTHAFQGLQVKDYLNKSTRAPVVPEEPRMIEQHIFFEPKTKIDVFEGLETLPNANLEFLPNNQCEKRINELLKVEKVELTKEQRKRLRDPFGAKNKRTKSTGHNPGKPLRKQIAERALEKKHALEKEGDTSKEKIGADTSLSESTKKDEGLPTDQKDDGVKSDKASHEDSSKAAISEGLSTDQKDDGVKSDKANHEDSSKAAIADYVIYQRKKKDAKKVSFAEPEQTPHVASIGARQQERKTSRKVPASKVNKDVQDTSKVAGQESKDDEVPIKLSKAFQDVPNAPSFSLWVSSQESGDSLTDSIAAEAVRQADEVVRKKKEERRRQRTHYGDTSDDDTLETPLECRMYPNINIATANKFIASREAEHLYNHVYTWRTRDASLSPVIFDNGNIKATASEIATSIAPCRCFESLVIAIAAQVLSTAKGQERKKFLSTYDTYRNLVMQQLLMAEGYLDSQRLLNLFNEDHSNFDYIMLPIYEPITERRKATDAHEGGHWFLVIVNFKDKQFDVVDSFRKPINAKLQDTSRKVKAKIVNLWNKVTSKREDGQVKDVWRFPIKYFEGFKQLNKVLMNCFSSGGMSLWDLKNLVSKVMPTHGSLGVDITSTPSSTSTAPDAVVAVGTVIPADSALSSSLDAWPSSESATSGCCPTPCGAIGIISVHINRFEVKVEQLIGSHSNCINIGSTFSLSNVDDVAAEEETAKCCVELVLRGRWEGGAPLANSGEGGRGAWRTGSGEGAVGARRTGSGKELLPRGKEAAARDGSGAGDGGSGSRVRRGRRQWSTGRWGRRWGRAAPGRRWGRAASGKEGERGRAAAAATNLESTLALSRFGFASPAVKGRSGQTRGSLTRVGTRCNAVPIESFLE
ncbi:hypothetical protein EJB05_54971, partial [Eragrostis curvula]